MDATCGVGSSSIGRLVGGAAAGAGSGRGVAVVGVWQWSGGGSATGFQLASSQCIPELSSHNVASSSHQGLLNCTLLVH